MISVVIPLYNKEAFIVETLESVLNQIFTEFEVIVINDGSSDSSLAKVSSLIDPRLKIVSIENSGVSAARNMGIDVALFEWIAFLDGDDWWAPAFLEEMVVSIKNYPDEKLFASGRSRVFKKELDRYAHSLLPKEGHTDKVNYFEVISRYLPLIHSSSSVIHRSLFESVGNFRPGQRKHEDHDLWMRLAVGQDVVFVNKSLSFYRKTEQNTASTDNFTTTDFNNFMDTMISVKEKISANERGYFKKYYNKYVPLVYLQYYVQYTKEEDVMVFKTMRKLLNGRALFAVRAIHNLPLKWFYSWYKKRRG